MHDHTRREGTTLILAGVHAQPLVAMHQAGFVERVGEENLTESLRQAIRRARTVLGLAPDPTPPSGVPEVRREGRAFGPEG